MKKHKKDEFKDAVCMLIYMAHNYSKFLEHITTEQGRERFDLIVGEVVRGLGLKAEDVLAGAKRKMAKMIKEGKCG